MTDELAAMREQYARESLDEKRRAYSAQKRRLLDLSGSTVAVAAKCTAHDDSDSFKRFELQRDQVLIIVTTDKIGSRALVFSADGGLAWLSADAWVTALVQL